MKKLLRKDFEAWLKQKAPEEMVGRAATTCDCPIAVWSGYRVDKEGYYPKRVRSLKDMFGQPLPRWVQKFIERVDYRSEGTPITAYEALMYLRRVK